MARRSTTSAASALSRAYQRSLKVLSKGTLRSGKRSASAVTRAAV